MNLSSVLGLGLALAGRAQLSRGPQALLLAEHYRLPLPKAGAFTIGNVVLVPKRTLAGDAGGISSRAEARRVAQ